MSLCDEYDYITFLIATQRIYSCTKIAKVQPEREDVPFMIHPLNRLLYRINLDAKYSIDLFRNCLC